MMKRHIEQPLLADERPVQSTTEKLRRHAPMFALYAFLILLLVLTKIQPFIPVASLTRDPVSILDGHFYQGALSNLGIVLWCAGASFCFFSFCVLRSWQPQRYANQAIIALATVTSALMFDDLFLIHDQFFPAYLGIPGEVVYAFLALSLLAILVFYRRTLVDGNWAYLVAAFVWFAISIALDIGMEETVTQATAGTDLNLLYLIEDGSKLLGIGAWCIYCFVVSIKQLKVASQTK